jgi:hypothetical protein
MIDALVTGFIVAAFIAMAPLWIIFAPIAVAAAGAVMVVIYPEVGMWLVLLAGVLVTLGWLRNKLKQLNTTEPT